MRLIHLFSSVVITKCGANYRLIAFISLFWQCAVRSLRMSVLHRLVMSAPNLVHSPSFSLFPAQSFSKNALALGRGAVCANSPFNSLLLHLSFAHFIQILHLLLPLTLHLLPLPAQVHITTHTIMTLTPHTPLLLPQMTTKSLLIQTLSHQLVTVH
jgi:hypothetical protein